MPKPEHVNPFQWDEAIGLARQACARIFRDGGRPIDAVRAFNLGADIPGELDWSRAVETIAYALCRQRGALKRAA